MQSSLSAYLIFLAFLAVILTGIGIRAFLNWRIPGARTLGLLMTSMAIWTGFYLLEIMHPDLSVKIFARKVYYLGITFAPALWLGYSLRYTGLSLWWAKFGRSAGLAIPGGIAFLLGSTNEFHYLIWKSFSLSLREPAPLIVEYGIGFWVYIAITYFLILAGVATHIIAYIRDGKAFRIKTGVVLTGVALSAMVNLFFLFFEHNLIVDPTPLSFALSAPLIALGFFRFGTTSLFPLAATLVVENLNDAIIVVNNFHEVTDINQAASALLGLKNVHKKLQVFSVLPHADRIRGIWDKPEASIHLEVKQGEATKCYEVRVTPISIPQEKILGHIVVFHDITNEQNLLRAERRRSQQLALLEETGRRIANSFNERQILQYAVDAITQKFEYPETAISILTEDGMLEAAAISGMTDFGYRPGYRQKLGDGIIGYTASIQKTYISADVSKDTHYFSTSTRSGSAICTPIFKQGSLYGVLYVESFELNAFDELDVITLETLASQISASLQRAALHIQTQNDLRTLNTIQGISKLIVSSLDLETISQTVVQSLKDSFGYTHVSIYSADGEYLHMKAQVGYSEERALPKIHISQGVIGKTYRTRSIHFIKDIAREETYLNADDYITSEICIPLVKDDIVLGILNVEADRERELTQADVNVLTAIAGPIAVSMDNARLHAQLKEMATTDAVTGLSNRHVFEQALHAEVERAERNQSLLSLIIFDIDFFKQFNDLYGHPAGDARLKAVANIIKQNLRKYDIAARYGGDEFAIILSECNQQNALMFAERLRQGTWAGAPQSQNSEGIPGYTLSLGIATYPQDANQPSALLIEADNAAMRAKQQGRNRIKLASDYETT